MAKFGKICVLVVTFLGVFSLCQADYIDNQLQNTQLVKKTIGCALDQQQCDAFGITVKGRLIEYFGNGCGRCTQQQLNEATRVGAFLASRYPEEWSAIVAKYQRNGRRG